MMLEDKLTEAVRLLHIYMQDPDPEDRAMLIQIEDGGLNSGMQVLRATLARVEVERKYAEQAADALRVKLNAVTSERDLSRRANNALIEDRARHLNQLCHILGDCESSNVTDEIERLAKRLEQAKRELGELEAERTATRYERHGP